MSGTSKSNPGKEVFVVFVIYLVCGEHVDNWDLSMLSISQVCAYALRV